MTYIDLWQGLQSHRLTCSIFKCISSGSPVISLVWACTFIIATSLGSFRALNNSLMVSAFLMGLPADLKKSAPPDWSIVMSIPKSIPGVNVYVSSSSGSHCTYCSKCLQPCSLCKTRWWEWFLYLLLDRYLFSVWTPLIIGPKAISKNNQNLHKQWRF